MTENEKTAKHEDGAYWCDSCRRQNIGGQVCAACLEGRPSNYQERNNQPEGK